MRKLLLPLIVLIVSHSAGTACSPLRNQTPVSAQSGASPSPSPATEPSPSPTPNSPIRSVDFENFTYPEINARGTFTFVNGREPTENDPRGLVDVVYGDVTGDGREEAMVVQSQSVRGSAIPFYVHVYTTERDRLRPIWSFYAGERGDGGLRQISAVDGELVIELYGRDRVVNGGTSVGEDNVGVCCPRFYTRSRYEWRGRRFRLKEKEEALPHQGGAAYLSLSGRRGRVVALVHKSDREAHFKTDVELLRGRAPEEFITVSMRMANVLRSSHLNERSAA